MSYSVDVKSVKSMACLQQNKMREVAAHHEKLNNELLLRNQGQLIEKSEIKSQNGEYEPE